MTRKIGFALAFIWELATPLIWRQASISRYGASLGAEIFWPLIPLIVWLTIETARGSRVNLDETEDDVFGGQK